MDQYNSRDQWVRALEPTKMSGPHITCLMDMYNGSMQLLWYYWLMDSLTWSFTMGLYLMITTISIFNEFLPRIHWRRSAEMIVQIMIIMDLPTHIVGLRLLSSWAIHFLCIELGHPTRGFPPARRSDQISVNLFLEVVDPSNTRRFCGQSSMPQLEALSWTKFSLNFALWSPTDFIQYGK